MAAAAAGCVTTGGEVVSAGVSALIVAVAVAGVVWLGHASGARLYRRRLVKWWNWGVVGAVGVGGAVAVVVGAVMLVLGAEFACA